MTRDEAHYGIVITGLATALVTIEWTSLSARTLRDEATPDSEEKAAYRFVTTLLDEARATLKDAEARLADLQHGARRAN